MSEKESKLAIEERQVGDVVVLSLKGEITLDDGELKFGRRIYGLLKEGQRKILVDLAGVTYIDSAGVGIIIAKYVSVRRAGGDVKLLNLSRRSVRVMTITRLLEVFETFDSEKEAVESFGARSAAPSQPAARRGSA